MAVGQAVVFAGRPYIELSQPMVTGGGPNIIIVGRCFSCTVSVVIEKFYAPPGPPDPRCMGPIIFCHVNPPRGNKREREERADSIERVTPSSTFSSPLAAVASSPLRFILSPPAMRLSLPDPLPLLPRVAPHAAWRCLETQVSLPLYRRMELRRWDCRPAIIGAPEKTVQRELHRDRERSSTPKALPQAQHRESSRRGGAGEQVESRQSSSAALAGGR